MDEEITAEELHQLIEDGEEVDIVDIRPEPHFQPGYIQGSVNIPFMRLPRRIDELDGAQTVVTVCPHGESSLQAARLVRSYEGIPDDAKVVSLAGGLEGWKYGLEAGADRSSGTEKQVDSADETNGPRSPF